MRNWIWPFLLLLVGCATPMSYYQNTSPELKLEEFYNGKLTAYGMVQNRSGKVLRRFKVDMVGNWEGNKGVLDEMFYYDDGEEQRRTWYLEKHADGIYGGTASDVVNPAKGQTSGYALNWRYTLTITVDGKTWDIDFDDWMYLMDENRLINRAKMKKWGFKVGEVTLWIEKD
ncbi:MAG: DUF3833 domain-containing protein [Gammaproteobacteria bacterium]|nr:DUF3833 domain-containing protein [Gammaproteobacteria bacterium]